jgi:glycosyltransferase involved in cell wall biosynthesis
MTIMNAPPYLVASGHRMKGREKIVLYQGLYFPYRGLEQLIESARYLERGRIVLRGYGYWEPHLRSLVQHWSLQERVEFAAPVPMTELVKAAAEADVGVAPFLPVCLNTRFCLPNKLFEYMMAGLAIVGSDLPEMRRIIVGHELGGVFNPEHPREIARVLNDVLADDARLARAQSHALYWAKTRYNWEVESQNLLAVYGSAFSGQSPPANGHREHLPRTDEQPAAMQACQPR